MASAPDRLRLKDRITANVAKAIKSIQEYQVFQGCGEEPIVLSNEDRPCQKLTEHLDHVFLHGLKHINHGYWKVVTEFSRKDAVKEILRLRNVTTDLGRGRAWLMMALNECLLESYINCYLDNKKLVKRHYVKEAFVLDDQRMNLLLTLTSGLEYAVFQLDYNVAYLDLSAYPPGSRSRSDTGNSGDDDRLSLCSMDSITTSRQLSNTTTKLDHLPEGDTCSVNSSEGASNGQSLAYKAESASVDSGIQLNEKETNSLSNQNDQQSKFRGHDKEVEVKDEELEVIRVSSGHKTKKKKSKKSGKQTSIKKQHSTVEKVAVETAKEAPSDLSWLPQEPIFPEELPDRSPGDGRESTGSKENGDDSPISEFYLKGPVHDKAKVMENYNIAFVEDSEYNIYKESKAPPHSQSDFVLSNTQKSSDVSREQQALDLACSTVTANKNNESLTSEVVSDVPSNDSVQYKNISSCDDKVLLSKGDNLLEENVSEVVTIEDNSSNSKDIYDGPETNVESPSKKSATSEMQDRVNNMINQSNAMLHKHMFEEEPEDVNIEEVADDESEKESICEGEIRLDNNTKLYLMLDVFDDSEEQFIKAFGTRTGHNEGDAKPVILLITDRSIHLLSQTQSDHRFVKDVSIAFSQLDYISLSVSEQFIQIVCTNRRKQYWITTGNILVTKSIISCLSLAMKKSGYDIPQLSVLSDATTQRIALKKYAAKECQCDVADVKICCYSLVHWDDPSTKGGNSESAYREGHLLYKIHETASSLSNTLLQTVQDPTSLLYGVPWRTGYVVLRDGLLCIYSSKEESKPLQFIQLGGDDCVGCRRSSDTDRDNCIKIIQSNGTTWWLSLATEEEANDWVQNLCQAVAHGVQRNSNIVSCLPCCMLLTHQKLLMCHEDVQISFLRTLGSANVLDITGVLVDTTVKTYCVLEFESHDNGVSKDQWVLHFNGQSETDRFLQALSSAWELQFQVEVPVSPICDFPLQRRCREMADQLQTSLQVKA